MWKNYICFFIYNDLHRFHVHSWSHKLMACCFWSELRWKEFIIDNEIKWTQSNFTAVSTTHSPCKNFLCNTDFDIFYHKLALHEFSLQNRFWSTVPNVKLTRQLTPIMLILLVSKLVFHDWSLWNIQLIIDRSTK